jgi:hypothetical protein
LHFPGGLKATDHGDLIFGPFLSFFLFFGEMIVATAKIWLAEGLSNFFFLLLSGATDGLYVCYYFLCKT